MRKKALLVGVVLTMTLTAVGCSKEAKNEKDTVTESVTEDVTESVTDAATPEAEENTDKEKTEESEKKQDVKVTLGKYKGVEVTLADTKVTDEEVNSVLESFNKAYGVPIQVTDRKDVKDGDIVNIDFKGTIDGKAFEGGTAQDQFLTIGSGQFIEGFEAGLIGKNVGDTVDVNVTFPENYDSKDLAGKPAVFEVKINYIDSGEREELTDKVVADNDPAGNKTVSEFKNYVKTTLESQKKENADTQKEIDVVKKIIEDTKFEGLEQSEIDDHEKQMRERYEAAAAQQGMDLERYIYTVYSGMTMDVFNEQLKSASDYNVKREYILGQIVKDENMTVSDKDYDAKVAEYMKTYNYTDKDKFITEMGGDDVVREAILLDNAMKLIIDEAVVKTK